MTLSHMVFEVLEIIDLMPYYGCCVAYFVYGLFELGHLMDSKILVESYWHCVAQ